MILEVESSNTIDVVKNKIQDKTGIPPSMQLLVYYSRVLEDGLTLANYYIKDESTVLLLTKATTQSCSGSMQIFISRLKGTPHRLYHPAFMSFLL
jgi:large subunit ribosomal protein L40e